MSVFVPEGEFVTVTTTGADVLIAPVLSVARAVKVAVPSGALLQVNV